MTAIQLRNIKKFLEDSAFTHTEEWLSACIEWIKENCAPVTDAIIRSQVLEQWQDANLEDMESRCLPANLADQKCTRLTGRYGLQVNSFQDIGESSYNQWNRIKKLENENTNVAATDSTDTKTSWEPKPRRCLYLTLTDGSQKVYGLELNPINVLNLNLKPGIKIIVSGPVECRRGVLQLKPVNVKVVGGEVEDFVERNSVESLLRTVLHNPPENASQVVPNRGNVQRNSRNDAEVVGEFPDSLDAPEPPMFDDDDIFMEIDESEILASAALTNSERANAVTQKIVMNNRDNVIPRPQQRLSVPVQSGSRVTTNQNPTIVNRMPPPRAPDPAKSRSTPTVKPNAVISLSRNNASKPGTLTGFKSAKSIPAPKSKKQLKIDGYMKPMPVIIKPKTPQKHAESNNVHPNVDDTILLASDDDDEALMDIIEGSFAAELEKAEMESMAADGSEPEIIPPKNSFGSAPVKSPPMGVVRPTTSLRIPINVPAPPYIYLKQVLENRDSLEETKEIVYVKACIATVVSNIQVSNGSWALTVSINDGTGFLNCRVSSDILNTIIGFTPTEMKQIKSTKTPEAKERIAKGMASLPSTLVHLNAILGIEVGADPVIVQFDDVMLHHVIGLKNRISHISQ